MISTKTIIGIIIIAASLGIAATSLYSLTTPTQKVQQATEDVNVSLNNMIDLCVKTLPNGLPQCDISLREQVRKSCEQSNNKLDACNDDRVDNYYMVRANTVSVTTQNDNEQTGAELENAVKPLPYEKTSDQLTALENNIKIEKNQIVRYCVDKVRHYNALPDDMIKQIQEGTISQKNIIELMDELNICDHNMSDLEKQCDIDGLCFRSAIQTYYELRNQKPH
ncbi:MAG: hypothetical protein ACREAE_06605 [Nitrosopumilaceae archaeon]